MSSTVNAGHFLGLKGENCTLLKIHGVKELVTDDGFDLIQLLRSGQLGGGGVNDEVASSLSNIMARLDNIEQYLQNNPILPPKDGPAGPAGPAGPKGDKGDKGDTGAAGTSSKRKVKLADLVDVDTTGVEDGAILVYSDKAEKFVISLD